MTLRPNLALDTDSYKVTHYLQYPPDTKYISSYIEARGVSNDFPLTNEIVFMGITNALERFRTHNLDMFQVVEAQSFVEAHIPGFQFNTKGWAKIVNEYKGFLPLQIESLPEGSVVPLGTPLVQVVNTDPELFWLTSYIETQLLRDIWYPTTVATLSRLIKKKFKGYLDLSSDNPEVIDFMLHDFGARGVSSAESAAIGGTAHLVNFKGSDTLEAIRWIRRNYSEGTLPYFYMPAFSVPAAEHSTITSWGRENEAAAYENMVDQFSKPGSIYAVVSDSYDIFDATAKIWGDKLKGKVLKSGGRLVIRPDSGDPVEVISILLDMLGNLFGTTTNSKGYKVLHPSVRIIQGDGVDYYSIDDILQTITKNGWSAENLVFGMGGALLQKVNRDSLKFAMKASAAQVGDEWRDVFKDPITDKGKRSKRGRLGVADDYSAVPASQNKRLIPKYCVVKGDKFFAQQDSFEEVRARAAI